ncbi:2,3-diaminopropionate biosynthesis protein SbnB [Snuella sedimenti]|uniref:2,3-diaminopropionate biosynthesis protein SbnB n=1 Tax=Snuella sedimenti TaxID=2798802 RepID=A0A8J7IIG6_9FLAO|nr:2,3-diaminopropionate biosynthesis protein SbnB [Snuella sedimenti]MBJ6369618.1 2,3-diaminopropionate biosynthesis protein SbnB [Snuella sedimenti]
MKYLGESEIKELKLNWQLLIGEIYKASKIYAKGDFCQPIKPYLRYKDLKNRIIAMPAYIGGDINVAGIKWIASFPKNTESNINRAHSTIILNEEATGIPYAIINTPYLSAVRTASVTGAIIDKYMKINVSEKLNVGIIGYGPIGQMHLQMIEDQFGDKIEQYYIYDLNPEVFAEIPLNVKDKVSVMAAWDKVFEVSDILCTCTVSKSPYIDKKPKPNSLHLNVSLRDYKDSFLDYTDIVIVDNWEEVCRENTDIEMMHKNKGLQKEDTITMAEFLFDNNFDAKDKIIMFNPMGLAVFDMAIAKQFYIDCEKENKGIVLE